MRLHIREWEDGLGDYSAGLIELGTGEQFVLRRFSWSGSPLDVLGQLLYDANDQVARLLAALGIDRDRVEWQVEPAAWRELQVAHKKYRRQHPDDA